MDTPLRLAVIVALVAAGVLMNAWYRRRARADAARHADAWPTLPSDVLEQVASSRAWVIFTTPVCASCRQVEAALHRDRSDDAVVLIDATVQPDLADRYDVRRAPTTLVVDETGQVRARLVGVEDVLAHLGAVAA